MSFVIAGCHAFKHFLYTVAYLGNVIKSNKKKSDYLILHDAQLGRLGYQIEIRHFVQLFILFSGLYLAPAVADPVVDTGLKS